MKKQKSNVLSKIFIFLFSFQLFTISSCSQNETIVKEVLEVETMVGKEKKEKRAPHRYGGWYCPDNIFGFPAVDLDTFDRIRVVNDRLPTKEETRSSLSLIYVDSKEHPDARAIHIPLPSLGRFYNEHTGKNEVVIVIQALEIGIDSILGFRYLNGGNGSCWFDEIQFLNEEESKSLSSTSFVSEEIVIHTTKKNVWNIITHPLHSQRLGENFGNGVFVESDWKEDSKVITRYANGVVAKEGDITAIWQDLYIQIDYDFNGHHYVEKIFLQYNREDNHTTLHLLAGPYGSEYEGRKEAWKSWLRTVKGLSESINTLTDFYKE